MSIQLQTVDENAEGQRLDNYLLKQLKGVPKSHIYRVIRKGEVRVNKGRKKADYKLLLGDVVRVPPVRVAQSNTATASDLLVQSLQAGILYEDEGLLAINKPSGLAVHGGSGIGAGVIEALRPQYQQPIELVHRLDRATSGVLLIAKKRAVLKQLQAQLKARTIKKIYLGLVQHVWQKKQHRIDALLKHNSRLTVVDARGKAALSYFRPIQNYAHESYPASLVEIEIQTGRMHQIRAHAQYAGHPLAGDQKYGDWSFNRQLQKLGLKRLFLHAHQLTFSNPSSNQPLTITANLPEELTAFLQRL